MHRGAWNRVATLVVTNASRALVLCSSLTAVTGCECWSDDTALQVAADDAGRDVRIQVHGSAGATGIGAPVVRGAPSEAGAGGRQTYARSFEASTRDGSSEETLSDSAEPPEASTPASLLCGDAIRGPDEECDDGNQDDTDFCTKTCRVADRLALAADNVPAPSFKRRGLSVGHHVIAGSGKSAVMVFADTTSTPNEVRAAVYRGDGTRVGGDEGILVSDDKSPIEPTDAVVAALPGDSYAIAWTVVPLGGNARSVVMRSLDGTTGALGAIEVVSADPVANRDSVDAVWTGSELVVSWVDEADPATPQGRVQRYDASLNATRCEEDLSTAGTEEGTPTIAAFGGSYAGIWYEEMPDFRFEFHARAGSVTWSFPPIPRLSGDKLRLAALDGTHLFAAWTQPEYEPDGGYEISRLYGAVLDTAAPGVVTPFRIRGMSAALTSDPTRGDHSPAVAVGGGSAFVAWSSDAGVLNTGLDALVVKEMRWDAAKGLDLSVAEEPLPRDPVMQNSDFESDPALGFVPWTAGGTLFTAWIDRQRVFGRAERDPDIVAQTLPIPIVRLPPMDGGTDAQ